MFQMFRANVRLQLCHWFLPDPSMADGTPLGRRVTRRRGADDAARGTAGRESLGARSLGLVNFWGNGNRREQ